MEYSILTSINELMKYKDEWNKILEENNNSILFLELEWIALWLEHFGDEHKLYVVLFKDHGEVIGFCPLMITEKKIYKEINFIGYGISSYMDFVFKPEYREELIDYAVDLLSGLKENYLINLNGMSESSKNYELMIKRLSLSEILYINKQTRAYYFEIKDETFEDYYNNCFSSNSRKRIRNHENKFNKLGVLSYTRVNESQLDEMFNIYDKRWQKKSGRSYLSIQKNKDFFKQLVYKPNKAFKPIVYALCIDDKIISFVYSFEYKKIYVSKIIAHDNDFNFLSPGIIIIKKEIEEVFRSGFKIYDFGLGDEEYKTNWTDTYVNIQNIIFPCQNLISKLVFNKSKMQSQLISLLKKNKRIVKFKKSTLGQIKYLLSMENLSALFKRIKKSINEKGFLNFAGYFIIRQLEKIYYKKEYMVLVRYLVKGDTSNIDNLLIKEASFEDIDLLSETMNELPENIIKRLARGDKCILAETNGNIIHYCWIGFTNIEIPDIDYQDKLNKDSAYIYDYYTRKEYDKDEFFRNVLSYVFNNLYNSSYKRCFIAVNSKQKSTARMIFEESFTLKYIVKGIRRINNIKCITEEVGKA